MIPSPRAGEGSGGGAASARRSLPPRPSPYQGRGSTISHHEELYLGTPTKLAPSVSEGGTGTLWRRHLRALLAWDKL